MENNESKVKAPKSAHIIDLRQSGGGASAKSITPERPARPAAHVAKPSARRRRRASVPPAAVTSPVPEEATVLSDAPSVDASSAPVAQPLGRSDTASADFSGSTVPRRHRFWPAFWRFLVLLIVLGLVVGGGLYIYTHYYAT